MSAWNMKTRYLQQKLNIPMTKVSLILLLFLIPGKCQFILVELINERLNCTHQK